MWTCRATCSSRRKRGLRRGRCPRGSEMAESESGGKQDWAGRILLRWTGYVAARRWTLTLVLVIFGVVMSRMSAGVAWQADVLQFFSGDSPDVRDMQEVAGRPGVMNHLRFDLSLAG